MGETSSKRCRICHAVLHYFEGEWRHPLVGTREYNEAEMSSWKIHDPIVDERVEEDY